MSISQRWIRIDKVTFERAVVPFDLVVKVAKAHGVINLKVGFLETQFAMYELESDNEIEERGRCKACPLSE